MDPSEASIEANDMLECHCGECQGALVPRGWWMRHQQSLRTREQLQVLRQAHEGSSIHNTQDQAPGPGISEKDPLLDASSLDLATIDEELRSLEAIFLPSLTELTFTHPPLLTSQLSPAPHERNLAVDERDSSNRPFVYITSTLAHLRARLDQARPSPDSQAAAQRETLG